MVIYLKKASYFFALWLSQSQYCMALLGSDLIPSALMMCFKNFTFSWAKWHFTSLLLQLVIYPKPQLDFQSISRVSLS